MNYNNEMTIKFKSLSENEAFARTSVAIFIAPLNPTLAELNDIKTAVSEAVTNAIIHGYEDKKGEIYLECKIENNKIYIKIEDKGKGIRDIKKAMSPLYTSKPDMGRSGLGFTVMESFMDDIKVSSVIGEGTSVEMIKTINISDYDKERTGASICIK